MGSEPACWMFDVLTLDHHQEINDFEEAMGRLWSVPSVDIRALIRNNMGEQGSPRALQSRAIPLGFIVNMGPTLHFWEIILETYFIK